VAAHPSAADSAQAQGGIDLCQFEAGFDAQKLGHEVHTGEALGLGEALGEVLLELLLVGEVVQHGLDQQAGGVEDAGGAFAVEDGLVEVMVAAANGDVLFDEGV